MKKIKLELQDQIRKEMIETITRSYEDTHPVSYLIIELKRLEAKYNFND